MKIRRLKVGDKIRIACDLDYGRYTDLTEGMFQYAGKTATITKMCSSNPIVKFKIDLDMGRYYWYADAIVGVNKYE